MDDIKSMREAAGMTIKDLSTVSGVPLRTLQSWEYGERIPRDVYQIIKVADALGVSVEQYVANFADDAQSDVIRTWEVPRLGERSAPAKKISGRTLQEACDGNLCDLAYMVKPDRDSIVKLPAHARLEYSNSILGAAGGVKILIDCLVNSGPLVSGFFTEKYATYEVWCKASEEDI